jgi:septal ring factor EnvC (AmiA/AmiB activator)
LKAANKQLTEWDAELNQLHERNGDLGLKVQMLEQELKEARRDRETIEAQLSDEKQKNAAARKNFGDFPEPADLLNQLKARRKKSRADLADIEVALELLGQTGRAL